MTYIYFIRPYNQNFFKVGLTTSKPERRLKQLQTGCPYTLYIYACIETDTPEELEKELHLQLKRYHRKGEWFEVDERIIDDIVWQLEGKPPVYEMDDNLFVLQLHQTLISWEKPRIEITSLRKIVRENFQEVLNDWRGVGSAVPLGVYKTKVEAEAAELQIRKLLNLPYVRSWVNQYGVQELEEYWPE